MPVGALLRAAFPSLAEPLLAFTIHRDWSEIVGQEVSRRAQPGQLRAGALEVTVDNSPWLQELTLRQGELLGRLQARYGVEPIRALRLTLRTLPIEVEGAEHRMRGDERAPAGGRPGNRP